MPRSSVNSLAIRFSRQVPRAICTAQRQARNRTARSAASNSPVPLDQRPPFPRLFANRRSLSWSGIMNPLILLDEIPLQIPFEFPDDIVDGMRKIVVLVSQLALGLVGHIMVIATEVVGDYLVVQA